MNPPLRVLVNLTWLVPGVVGGSEESTTDAIRAVLEHEPSVEPTLAVLRGFAAAHPDLADACRNEVLDSTGANKAARVFAEQTWLARRTRELSPDLVHHAGGVLPLRHPGRTSLTIHDLQPLEMPENFSLAKRQYLRLMLRRSAHGADGICVPSEFTAGRVCELLGVESARVDVVPWSVVALDRVAVDLGPNPAARTDGEATGVAGDSAGTLFLYPAITYPHKNHRVLLDGFARYRQTNPEARLVLAGGPGASDEEVDRRCARPDLAGSVGRPGRVSSAEMERLYRRATAVLVPSRYEGFGLPALEAMGRGVPLVVSDAGSLPEVVATSAGWATPVAPVSPDDPAAWASAMETVAALDERARAEVASREVEAAAAFTPRRTAAALAGAWRRAAGRPGSTSPRSAP